MSCSLSPPCCQIGSVCPIQRYEASLLSRITVSAGGAEFAQRLYAANSSFIIKSENRDVELPTRTRRLPDRHVGPHLQGPAEWSTLWKPRTEGRKVEGRKIFNNTDLKCAVCFTKTRGGTGWDGGSSRGAGGWMRSGLQLFRVSEFF